MPTTPVIPSARIMLSTSGTPASLSFQSTNGVNRYAAPIERSISPSVITNTCPAAMIARKQKYGSSDLKLL